MEEQVLGAVLQALSRLVTSKALKGSGESGMGSRFLNYREEALGLSLLDEDGLGRGEFSDGEGVVEEHLQKEPYLCSKDKLKVSVAENAYGVEVGEGSSDCEKWSVVVANKIGADSGERRGMIEGKAVVEFNGEGLIQVNIPDGGAMPLDCTPLAVQKPAMGDGAAQWWESTVSDFQFGESEEGHSSEWVKRRFNKFSKFMGLSCEGYEQETMKLFMDIEKWWRLRSGSEASCQPVNPSSMIVRELKKLETSVNYEKRSNSLSVNRKSRAVIPLCSYEV